MSKNSRDIGLTPFEEMVLPTEPGAAPVAPKPHDLPPQTSQIHQR